MKKSIILILTILFVTMIVKAQDVFFDKGLVWSYQEKNPIEYRDNIERHAKDKWGTSSSKMIEIEIEHQIVSQYKIFKRIILVGGLYNPPGDTVTMSSEMKIIKRLIVKWSYPGWADSNREIVLKDEFGYEDFKDVHCDWGMVLTDYDAMLVIRNSE